MSKIIDYSIERNAHGTMVSVKVEGQFFPLLACSKCGIVSDNFPSFITPADRLTMAYEQEELDRQ